MLQYTDIMLILCADTAGSVLSFTLVDKEQEKAKLIHTDEFPCEGRMNEFFFTALDRFFKTSERDVSVRDIECWVSISGPGSFTGIRIGIAALSGISSGTGGEHIGLASLDAAALLSGRREVTVASKLRMKEYAVRSYNFEVNEFSGISVCQYDTVPEDIVLIGRDVKGLSRAVCDWRCGRFFGDTAAVYVKRSEAEINFDKKGNIK